MFRQIASICALGVGLWLVLAEPNLTPFATGTIIIVVVVILLVAQALDPKTKWYDMLDFGTDWWD